MKRTGDDAYFTSGPFSTIMGGKAPMARVLDQSLLIGNMVFTIATMTEATNLTFKTAQKHVQHLLELGWVRQKKKLGSAQTYSFNIEASPFKELVLWANKFQISKRPH